MPLVHARQRHAKAIGHDALLPVVSRTSGHGSVINRELYGLRRNPRAEKGCRQAEQVNLLFDTRAQISLLGRGEEFPIAAAPSLLKTKESA